MLPYPTSRRRLLMMVRTFVQDLNEFVRDDHPDATYPSDPDDPLSDLQLEEFFERLAVEAARTDRDLEEMGIGEETEAEVVESLNENMKALMGAAAWNDRQPSSN